MRVAICFSGQSRTFKQCYESQKKFILDPLQPDVFIHTWNFTGSTDIHSTHNKAYNINKYIDYVKSSKYTVDANDIIDLYRPKNIFIEDSDPSIFIDKIKKSKRFSEEEKIEGKDFRKLFYNDNKYKWFNMIMMYYGVYMSNKLKKNFEIHHNIKYDIVIRSRMDLYFEAFDISETIDLVKNNTIFLPPNQDINFRFNPEMMYHFNKRGPVFMPNDKLAYGNSESMDYYSSIYSFFNQDIDYYSHHGEGVISEHLWLKNNSIYKDIKVNDNIKMKILR